MASFRTEILTAPVTPQEYARLEQRRQAGEFGRRGSLLAQGAAVALVVAGVAVVAATVVVPHVSALLRGDGLDGSSVFALVWLAAVGLAAVQLARVLLGQVRGRKEWARVARFAEQHGLRYRFSSPAAPYPGMVFGVGHSRSRGPHVTSSTGPLVDCGTARYVTGSGKNRRTHRWGYAAFRLPAPMPHLLLDARANNVVGLSNLPAAFSGSQRVSLGHPFDEHYALMAPPGYAADAFYLFPPHVMARFLESPARYDVEVVDDWMFFYTQDEQDLADPTTWQRFDQLAGGVVAQMTQAAQRYRDRRLTEAPERTGEPQAVALTGPVWPGQVADQGRRLRRGLDPRLVAGIAVMVAVWVLLQVLR